ncbi:unnamed protein product [Miscanthus lutarioriparius]|uniref:Uncharacterized protein n=1 Tax=Miscanthus lutarioriparius TaxID=422564 RepID=A0A811PHD6_9POAL|nr:unnamed protein product [Miscanthus lutarioriparius]
MAGRPPPAEAAASAGASGVAGSSSLPRSLSTAAWIQGREGGRGSRAGKVATPSFSTVAARIWLGGFDNGRHGRIQHGSGRSSMGGWFRNENFIIDQMLTEAPKTAQELAITHAHIWLFLGPHLPRWLGPLCSGLGPLGGAGGAALWQAPPRRTARAWLPAPRRTAPRTRARAAAGSAAGWATRTCSYLLSNSPIGNSYEICQFSLLGRMSMKMDMPALTMSSRSILKMKQTVYLRNMHAPNLILNKVQIEIPPDLLQVEENDMGGTINGSSRASANLDMDDSDGH